MITYLIIAVAAICAICFIIGLFRGYTMLSFWGGTVAGAVFISRLCARWLPADNPYLGILYLSIALEALLALSFLFKRVRRYIVRATSASQKLSAYRQHDEREANEQEILVALDKNDKKAYRKLSKRKFRQSRGAWGVVDRVFGGLTLAINAAVVLAVLGSIALIAVDLAQIQMLTDMFAEVLTHTLWADFASRYAFDVIVVTLMCMCVRQGYKGGILSSLGAILNLILLCVAGYVSYHLAFNVSPFVSLAQNLTDGAFAGLLANISGVLEAVNIQPIVISQSAITVGLFLLFLIPVIIIGVFIPRVIDRIRGVAAVKAIDGACGAIVLFTVIFAVLMLAGALVYQMHDVEALARFNRYMESSRVASCLYNNNFIAELEFVKNIPIRSWFGLTD